MRERFEKQLYQLNQSLLEMGGLIERSIQSATGAMIHQDVEEAEAAIAFDHEVDQKEREIESLCLKLLLQQQPVAKDLRFVSAALKMITDMERIGDQSADIAGLVIYLAQEPYPKELVYLPQMAQTAMRMVTGSLDAYVNRNIDLARRVMAMDDAVDDLFDVVKDGLIELIRSHADAGSQAVDLLMIAKYLERIGDHAQNIAEWAEYAITGQHKGVWLT